MGSRFGALTEEEYDKIHVAPVIACTLPALTDSLPERKREELAGEVTSELQVVGKAASIAVQTWVRNNDKTKARAEEREKNFTTKLPRTTLGTGLARTGTNTGTPREPPKRLLRGWRGT